MAKRTDPKADPELELARYFASAFITHSHGIGMDYLPSRRVL